MYVPLTSIPLCLQDTLQFPPCVGEGAEKGAAKKSKRDLSGRGVKVGTNYAKLTI